MDSLRCGNVLSSRVCAFLLGLPEWLAVLLVNSTPVGLGGFPTVGAAMLPANIYCDKSHNTQLG
jgi:hypothetical protein